jgi:hypothetical protein
MLTFLAACGPNVPSGTSGEAMANESATTTEMTKVTEGKTESEPEPKIKNTSAAPFSSSLSISDIELDKENKLSEENLKIVTQKIKQEYARIEQLVTTNNTSLKELEFECPEDPQGGSFKFHFNNDSLLKATYSFYMGDHFGGESTYYFQNDQLFFAFHQNSTWNFAASDTDEPATRDDINEQRDYYYQGKLVNRLFKEYTHFSNKKKTPSNKVPNKTIGTPLDYTYEASKVLELATKDVLTCEDL